MGGAARTAEEHRYDRCSDANCPRWQCQIYRQGSAEGHLKGHAEGHAEGYAQGFTDGIAACPRPHGNG